MHIFYHIPIGIVADRGIGRAAINHDRLFIRGMASGSPGNDGPLADAYLGHPDSRDYDEQLGNRCRARMLNVRLSYDKDDDSRFIKRLFLLRPVVKVTCTSWASPYRDKKHHPYIRPEPRRFQRKKYSYRKRMPTMVVDERFSIGKPFVVVSMMSRTSCQIHALNAYYQIDLQANILFSVE